MSHWILQISSGVGPVEVRHFVALLVDELCRRCRAGGLVIGSVSSRGHGGDQAGNGQDAPRSVEIEVHGDAPAVMAGYLGTHVLVARSRQRGHRARKRWFAGVRLYPHARRTANAVMIQLSEVEMTAARAGGPGGQHVNTTSSAVRVRHKPSGIAVRVASERSQHQNKRRALERLAEILGERRAAESEKHDRNMRRHHYRIERGSPVKEWSPSDFAHLSKRMDVFM